MMTLTNPTHNVVVHDNCKIKLIVFVSMKIPYLVIYLLAAYKIYNATIVL